jgi:hypothetical protein
VGQLVGGGGQGSEHWDVLQLLNPCTQGAVQGCVERCAAARGLLAFGNTALSVAYSSKAFVVQRRYQLADWRVRPLPEDMLHYARADTHFLLAAADALRAELCAAGGRLPEGWAVNVPRHSGAAQVGGAGVVLSAHTAS